MKIGDRVTTTIPFAPPLGELIVTDFTDYGGVKCRKPPPDGFGSWCLPRDWLRVVETSIPAASEAPGMTATEPVVDRGLKYLAGLFGVQAIDISLPSSVQTAFRGLSRSIFELADAEQKDAAASQEIAASFRKDRDAARAALKTWQHKCADIGARLTEMTAERDKLRDAYFQTKPTVQIRIGDRVRLVKLPAPASGMVTSVPTLNLKIGDVGHVSETNYFFGDNDRYPKVYAVRFSQGGLYLADEHIELVPLFKIGDKVRLIKTKYLRDVSVGDIARVNGFYLGTDQYCIELAAGGMAIVTSDQIEAMVPRSTQWIVRKSGETKESWEARVLEATRSGAHVVVADPLA